MRHSEQQALKPGDLKGLIYVHPADNSLADGDAAIPDCATSIRNRQDRKGYFLCPCLCDPVMSKYK